MSDDGDRDDVTEQTATLLWEACRRDPDPAARPACARRRGRPGVGGARRLGSADRRAAVAGARCGGLVGRPRPRPGRVRRHGRRLQDGGAAPTSPRRRTRRAAAHRCRARAGRLQGPRRGGPLPRARFTADGRHRPAPAARRSPARPRSPGPRRVAGGAPRCRRPLRHRADPPRGSFLPARGPLRAGGRVRTADRTRSRTGCGGSGSRSSAPARAHSDCLRPRSSSYWPPMPGNRTTGSCAWCGWPTSR